MSENYTKIKQRVKTMEEAVQVLTALALRADERMDGFELDFTNLNLKLEALANAQIRTEEAVARLTEAQAHADKRLDALIDIVREEREGRKGPDGL